MGSWDIIILNTLFKDQFGLAGGKSNIHSMTCKKSVSFDKLNNTDKCGLMCTLIAQMITCYTVKPYWHKMVWIVKCGLLWANIMTIFRKLPLKARLVQTSANRDPIQGQFSRQVSNPKLWSHQAQFLAWFYLVLLPKFSHVHI